MQAFSGSTTSRRAVTTQALFGKKPANAPAKSAPVKNNKKSVKTSPKLDKARELSKKQGLFGRVTAALDFNEVRSTSDAELLYDAKYGERTADNRMTKEQYQALRRRIGGTAKDYWKTWVDVKGDYVDKGYVSSEDSSVSSSVPGLGFLIGTTGALLGTAAYVVLATSH